MRKLFYLLALFCTSLYYGQTNGITYQAVIYYPNGQNIPGQDIQNSPMTNKFVCLQFSLIDDLSQLEYQETIQTTTDEFGMVNLIIGSGTQVGGYAGSFNAVIWNSNLKTLKVELDPRGNCQDYIVLSDNPLSAVPFAYASVTANNVSGTVAILNGGTGANNPTDAKINLGLGNVDNTSDAVKPISTATQLALDAKEALSNKSTSTTLGTSDVLFPTQNAVKTYVDAQVASATIPDADALTKGKIQLAGDLSGTAAAPTVPALATKENTANKSAVTTLGTSDLLYPTQNAVKTYVDTNISTVNANNTALQATVTANANAATTAIAAVQADVDANEATGIATDTALQNNINTLQNTVATNATDTAADLALKEDTANKSAVTTLGTSDVLFPTQNAVKTYVDAQVASATIADADALTKGKIQLAGDLSGTAAAPTVPALASKENTANKSAVTTLGTSDVLFPTQNAVKTYVDLNITSVNNANSALQATVTANANAATTAIAAVQADVDANEATSTAADTALQNNITTLQNTVATNATNTAAALALKEDAANKSAVTTLGTSDQLFPTQNAVKTYVDLNITSVNNANSALQATVTANANAATTAIAAVQADVDANEATSTAADTALQNNITTLQNTVATNATNTAAALALKEDAANKSAVTTLGTSDVLFPTQNAVKTYVDTNITSVNSTITSLQGTVSANANSASTAIAAVQADVDANETTTNNALALKEDAANKSTTTTLGTSDQLFPTQNAVKTYVDAQVASATIADADATTKGKIQLTGDLGGTAASPTVPGLTNKEDAANKTIDLTTVDGTSDIKYPSAKATKDYVDSQIATGVVDASTLVKGKVQLAGDLTGTAALPEVAAGAITTAKLADDAVTTIKITDANVTTDKLANDAVETAKIKDANVTTDKLADDAVTTIKITDANVTTNKLAANAVTSAKILDGTIVVGDLANDAVETAKIKDANVTPAKLEAGNNNTVLVTDGSGVVAWLDATAFGAVADMTTIEGAGTTASPFVVKDLGIVTAKLAPNAVTSAKILDGTILVDDLANDAVETAKIKNENVTTAKLADDAVTTVKITNANVTTAKLADDAVETAKIKNANVTNDKLDKANIPLSGFAAAAADVDLGSNKLINVTDPTTAQDAATKNYVDTATSGITTLDDGKIYLGNASNVATEVTPTGDVTITNVGVTAIGTGKVVTSMLATDAVTTAKITNGNVTTAKLADDAVETSKIKNANVTNAKLDKSNIPLSGFAAATVDVDLGSNKLINVTNPTTAQDAATKNYVDTATSGITTLDDGKIYLGNASNVATEVTPTGDVTITNAGVTAIGTGKVVTAMLATDAVTTAKITDANVTSAKLADDAVETAKIKNANVTNAKLDKANIPLSGFGAAAADVDLGSNKLTNVTDPSSAQDAATKNYVDTATSSITTLTDGKVYVGNASNEATQVTPTGDVTITNAGVTAIGTSKVVTAMLATDAVTTVKITDANVTSAKLADDAVETAKIKNANVTYAKIQNVSATDKVLGRVSSGAGVIEEIATTGDGDVVRATSPTLVTPDLGIPSAIDLTNATALPLTSGVTGILPEANGGTGSATKNFVDLTTNQTIDGVKTFSGTSTIVNQNLTVNAAGTSGQGIILSDDGDIVDNNDGAATFRFTGGVRINNDKGVDGTTTKITLANTGNITATGSIESAGIKLTGGSPATGKVLTSDANGEGTWATLPVTNLESNVTGVLPIANGGTGSSTQNFVDLTSAQTIAGAKTFSGNTAVSGTSTFTVGTGATALGGTLGVTGATTLSSTLSAGASTLSSATITNNATVGGTFGVTGATTLSNTLSVTGNTTIGGTTTLNGNTSVSGSNTLTVGTGATTLGGTLAVTGATTLSSTLGVTGDVAVNTDKFKITASSGNTEIAGTIKIAGGSPSAGKVLVSDANGLASWSSNSNGGASLISATATMAATDTYNLIVFSGSTAGQTITLPSASSAGAGREITIKNIASVSVRVNASGGSLISDSTTTSATELNIGIEPSNNWIKAISTGTNWIILRGLF